MRYAIARIKPNALVHLGDYYDDADGLADENAGVVLHQVPGNCDRFRVSETLPRVLCYTFDGVRVFMTHGHLHKVKQGTGALLSDARRAGAQAVLYGHTHIPDCHCEADGLWVLNPGTCGSYGGTVGLLETENGKIKTCRIIGQAELEETV